MKIIHNVWVRISAVFAAFIAIFFCLFSTVYKANADTSRALTSYDTRSIYEDLNDLGKNPDLYIKSSLLKPKAISFMEYCYSENAFISQSYYGLYVYMYNPSGTAVSSRGNVITMATSYKDDKVLSYDSVPLKLLDSTADNLLLKFKVENAYERFYTMEKLYSRDNVEGERRYDIVGVQLSFDKAEDTTYGTTFYFSGYSSGCGENVDSASTLKTRSEGLETINLNVGHSYYRTRDYVDNVCDELNTVYFSVPKKYFEDYGGLQKIKATWEEYKTTPVFVTNEEAAYDALKPYLMEDIGNDKDELPYRVLWDRYHDYGTAYSTGNINSYYTFKKAYNRLTGESTESLGKYTLGLTTYHHWKDQNSYGESITDINRMAWLFYRPDAVEDSTVNDWKVTSSEMENYIIEKSKQFAGLGQNNVGRKNYLSYLFEDSIDSDRIKYLDDKTASRGRITQEIDAGEQKNLLVEKNQSWWDELWHGVEYTNKAYSPIVTFSNIDELKVSNAKDFAKKYYLNEDDCVSTDDKKGIYDWCKDELAAGNYPVLFRFAKTDYTVYDAYFDNEDNKAFTGLDGYVSQETVFFDFDIISLTFRDDNSNDTVIGVVADPIDIINGLDPSPGLSTSGNGCGSNGCDLSWEGFLAFISGLLISLVIGFLLILLIVWLIKGGIKLIFNGIVFLLKWTGLGLWWVIKLPFVGLKKLFRRG